jgi:zinc finger BED domain-containing protein 1 (E3 SUMO-protein ligase ZBED1)
MINVDLEDFDQSEGLSSVRLSCFAHTIQLCVRDGLKNVSHISRVLDKCQILEKCSNQSTQIADLLDERNKHINRMTITRWNSEYMLIKSILSIGKTDLESIVKLMDNPVTFLNNDFTILEEIIDILEPFYEISIKCQAATIVTVSLVVPAIVHLISHLRNIKVNLSFCTKLVEQLQASIEKRFSGIVHRLNLVNVEENDPFNDPLYFIAAVLDPSFKFLWIRDLKLPGNFENRLKQNVIQLILDDIDKDFPELPQSRDETSSLSFTTTVPPSSMPKSKRKKMFTYTDDNDDANHILPLDPATELQTYLNDPVRSRFAEYWFHSRLQQLKKLVTRVFSVQASSAPAERVFSHAGLILSSRRTNMSEELFKDLVFLKVNQSLL